MSKTEKQKMLADAQKKMEAASKSYRASFHADFLMGLHAVSTKQFDIARQRFEDCVERGRAMRLVSGPVGETNYLRALNNLALAKVRDDELEEAHGLWVEALKIRPDPSPELAHNVFRTWRYMQAAQGGPVLKVSDGTLKKFSDLADTLGTQQAGARADRGWEYLGYLAPANLTGASAPSTSATDRILVGRGSAVIVEQGYMLSSRNLGCDGNLNVHSMRIRHAPHNSDAGRVVAVDDRWDLALIHDPSIQGEGIGLNSAAVQSIGESPMLVGFFPKSPNKDLQSTAKSCAVTILPSPKQVLYSLTSDASDLTNGSLLVNESSHVIGLVVAGARVNLPSAVDITPVDSINKFLGQHIPNYAPRATSIAVDREDIASAFSPNIVHIESFSHASATSHPKSTAASLATIFSASVRDNACLLCDGDSKVKCPARGCANGAVAVDANFQIRDPLTKGVKNVPTKSSRPCSACGGSGQVRCPACSNGTDTFRIK
jgi:hypothetical protein